MKPAAIVGALATVGLLAAYAIVSHLLIVSDDRTELGYLFAIVSVGVMAAAAGWATRWRWPIALLVTLAAAGGWALRERVGWDPRWLYLLQHAGVHIALGLFFGRSLRAGRTPLITTLATVIHGTLPPHITPYTRSVTTAWTLYFFGMAGCSLLLFMAGPAGWWSVLANFLTPPAIALVFVVEYAIRRQRFPDFPHARLLDGIRAFGRAR